MLQPLGISAEAEAVYVALARRKRHRVGELARLERPRRRRLAQPGALRELGLATEHAAAAGRRCPSWTPSTLFEPSDSRSWNSPAWPRSPCRTGCWPDPDQRRTTSRSWSAGRRSSPPDGSLQRAQKEICNFDKPPYVQARPNATGTLHDDAPEWQALERGLSLRCIYHPGFDADRLAELGAVRRPRRAVANRTGADEDVSHRQARSP